MRITDSRAWTDAWILANGGYKHVSRHARDYLNKYEGNQEIERLAKLYKFDPEMMPELLKALCLEKVWIVKGDKKYTLDVE